MELQQGNSKQLSISKIKDNLSSQNETEVKRSRPFSQQSSKYQSIRKKINRQIEFDSQQSDLPQNWGHERSDKLQNQIGLQAIQQQQSVVSSDIPMREKFGHLLPGCLGAKYSLEHRKLFKIQSTLDQLLDHLRGHRDAKNGVFFSVIKRSLSDSVFIQIQNIKQIMFLAPHFYIVEARLNKSQKKEYCVSLPTVDDVAGHKRNTQFRQILYKYVMDHKHEHKNQLDLVKIPQKKFDFEKADEPKSKNGIIENLKNRNLFFLKQDKSSKINPFDVIKYGTDHFEKILITQIKDREREMNERKQKMANIVICEEEILKTIDEISRIYKSNEKTCMFKLTLIQHLDKILTLNIELISKIVDEIIERYPKLLQASEHQGGLILQYHRKFFNEVRKELQRKINRQEIFKNKKENEQENKKSNEQQNINSLLKSLIEQKKEKKQVSVLQKSSTNVYNSKINPITQPRVSFSLQPQFRPLDTSKYFFKKKNLQK